MAPGNYPMASTTRPFDGEWRSSDSSSMEEIQAFQHLQDQLAHQFEFSFPNKLASKTVVIIPSLTLDQAILQKIDGIVHYEERLLCLLMLLRMPRTRLVFVTSIPIDPVVVDYYLHLLPGITGYHARQRLTLLSCFDASPLSLTEKILNRPRLMERIKSHIRETEVAHMSCFNVTPYERTLAVKLNIPIYGCDPDLFSLGNKSNGRKLFTEAGLQIPDGFEDLSSTMEIAEALTALKLQHPDLEKAVVKMNEGFSGEGNAVFSYPPQLKRSETTPKRLHDLLSSQLNVVAPDLTPNLFLDMFEHMGGIVELFVQGKSKTSPSVQCRINPLGVCDIISTHDQVLGGDDGQVFLGAYFPAHESYATHLAKVTMPLAKLLRDKGVIGRFGVDFISVKNDDDEWKHYAIEINMRKGGTTHPFLMLNFLTEGVYHSNTGIYKIKTGQPRHYFSTDNLVERNYRGLTPHDLIEIATDNDLMFNGAAQEGVMFHIIGALSQYGKLGVLAIGASRESARRYYDQTKRVLCEACG
jgi:hypothetical protein